MHSKWIRPIPNRPWGRKRYLLPLPILSLLLLGTALVAPAQLRMTFNVFDDPNLTILASVQNVVHPDGPEGKIIGLITVTNHGSTDTRLTVASATIRSLGDDGTPDGRLVATIALRVPLTVRAGETIRMSFMGPFTGSVMTLNFGDSFDVSPEVTWFSVPESGPEEGPFTYAQARTCTVEGDSLPPNAWNVVCR